MFGTHISRACVATALMALALVANADPKVTPCVVGSGSQNGCSFCADNSSINVTPWSTATWSHNFDLPEAGSTEKGGYDVWWDIYQPDPGCRIVLMTPYITDKGNTDPRLAGNVVLSTAHAGCYFAHVTGDISAGYCCGTGECSSAGAIPAPSKKRELPPSRIIRSLPPGQFERETGDLAVRSWGRPPPPPPAPVLTCSAPTPVGDSYTRPGKQQILGNTLSCTGGESCNISPAMSVSASVSIMNEQSVTSTTSTGFSVSIMAGFMMMDGPMMSVTDTFSKDWSDSVTHATSDTTSNTVTASLTFTIGLKAGPNFNLWFTPTLRCQSLKINCDGVELSIERCAPVLDGEGKPTGQSGVMAVG